MRMKPSFCSTPCAATWRTTSASPGVQLQVRPKVHLHVCSDCNDRCLGKCSMRFARHSMVLRDHLQHALLAAMCCWVPAVRPWSGSHLPAASNTCACLP